MKRRCSAALFEAVVILGRALAVDGPKIVGVDCVIQKLDHVEDLTQDPLDVVAINVGKRVALEPSLCRWRGPRQLDRSVLGRDAPGARTASGFPASRGGPTPTTGRLHTTGQPCARAW